MTRDFRYKIKLGKPRKRMRCAGGPVGKNEAKKGRGGVKGCTIGLKVAAKVISAKQPRQLAYFLKNERNWEKG